MQKITPFLWFDNQAEEAVNLYSSIFKNSKVGSIARYGEEGPGSKGTVMTATCNLGALENLVRDRALCKDQREA